MREALRNDPSVSFRDGVVGRDAHAGRNHFGLAVAPEARGLLCGASMGRLSIVLSVFLLANVAHASGDDTLTIGVAGFGSWPEAVASVQGDTTAEGRVLQVTVHDGSPAAIPCGSYTLALDDVASQAFSIESCDPSTGATTLRLVNRAALFAHDDLVPRPLMAGISAVLVLHGGSAGGAQSVGGSELFCSVAVRPFLQDLEHGTRVFLAPGRFVLRPIAAGVSVETGSEGWTLRGPAGGALTVEYEVFDTLRSTVVVRDRATLQCLTESIEPVAAPPPIVRTDAAASGMTVGGISVGVRPTPTSPGASFLTGLVLPSLVYLPLSNVGFRSADLVAHGTDLALRDAWMGAIGANFVGEFRYALASLRIEGAISDHVVMLDSRSTIAGGARGAGAFWYVGPQLQVWGAWLHGIGQRTWATGLNAALAVEAGVRVPTSVRWRADRGNFRLGEIAVALSVPVAGDGAWFLTWEGAWGVGR